MAKPETTGIRLIEQFTQRPIELHLLCQTQNFPDLNSFLHCINPNNPHDLLTVESYLFGNELTTLTPKAQLVTQYRNTEWGKPEIADAISLLLPNYIYPTHFFQVAFVAAKDPGDPITKINGCAIFPGTVLSIDRSSAVVLRPQYPSFKLVKQSIELGLNQKPKINDLVAIHLNQAFTLLTQHQFDNLNFWNRKVAALI